MQTLSGKRPLPIAAMNAELLPIKNGEHNSESVSIIDPLIIRGAALIKGYTQ